MGREAVIRVSTLEARYGETVILKDVSFEVYRGEIFVILGGNGSGKSTLLKHMIGLYQPYSGEVLIEGQDITKATGRVLKDILRKFGVLYQGGALFGSMTVAENVALPLKEYTSLPRQTVDLLVRMKLNIVNMSGYEDHFPSELSGGLKKRAALARAMALDPKILFFDEPSAGLDPVISAELDHLIIQLNASLGTTMVVVTHELPSIFTIAQRVIMLDSRVQGIFAQGDPIHLRDHSENPWVRDFFERKGESHHGG